MNDDNGIVECRIQGTSITAELLGDYLRAWSRHGIFFHTGRTRHAAPYHADILTYRFSYSHPDPTLRGELNPHFLNPEQCARSLQPASVYPGGCVVLSVPRIPPAEDVRFVRFLDRLDAFLAGLPAMYRYAVGVENPEYLLPEYFACLRRHAVAHLFLTLPELPGLLDQAQWPHALTAEVACVLTVPGLEADWQLGMMELIRRCIDAGKRLHVFAAGGYSSTISLAVLMERMNADLARLSPIRTVAA
jgi:hypothetical protein